MDVDVDRSSNILSPAICSRDSAAESRATIAVPLLVSRSNTAATPLPVSFGVPFPRGALHGEHFAASLEFGERQIDAQAMALGRWSDGSVRWLLGDVVPPRAMNDEVAVTMYLWPVNHPPAVGVTVKEENDSWTVATGAAEFIVDRRTFLPFRRINLAGGGVRIDEASAIQLVDAKGTDRNCVVEEALIESAGPIRTTLKFCGSISGSAGLRWQARLSFFVASGLAHLRFAIHNPHAARHRGGIWDLGDRGSRYFRALNLDVKSPPGINRRIRWMLDAASRHSSDNRRLSIYQGSSGGTNWQSRNHVDCNGCVPCVVPGFVEESSAGQRTGARAQPVVVCESDQGQLSVAVPQFWQQFPKAIDATVDGVRVGLFPRRWSNESLFELQGGERKSHSVWLSFGEASSDGVFPLEGVASPLRLRADPNWIRDTRAIDGFVPEDQADDRFRKYAQQAVDGPWSVAAGRETVDEYGWRNFGDLWANHEALYYTGPAPIISHYNNQFDYLNGAILQWLQNGNERWRDIFEPLAQHVMDIDRYQTDADRAAYNGGLFWFTDHYLTAATSTHRTYSKANAPASGAPYGGGPGSEHNFSTGLFHFYCLSGDDDAREAVLGLAEWVIRMDDGQATVLKMVDAGPTGLASAHWGGEPKCPGRGAANSIQVLLDAWLVDRSARYLCKAEELIRRSIHPRDDLSALKVLNAEKSWSYTMFLAAIDRYLAVKEEAGQIDANYAYTQASYVHYAEWMLDNERPYLDRREELEYPTEAWAAQEFRKANVLRRAARHVDAETARRVFERGTELAERAWRDLLSFDTQATARAMALLLTEGMWDSYLRCEALSAAPRYDERIDFGKPEPFRSQRYRIKQRAKSLRGILGLGVEVLTSPLRRSKRDSSGDRVVSSNHD